MKYFWLSWSTWFGLGLPKVAPGTFGTLGALPIWYFTQNWETVPRVALTLVLALWAVVVSSKAESIYGGHDSKHIVIDEVSGMMICAHFVPFEWPMFGIAFLFFRFFDILKPPPIGTLDRKVDGGLGVCIDDWVAGLFAGLASLGVYSLMG